MPVAFASSPPRVISNVDKNKKSSDKNQRATAAGRRTKLRTTSESSSFAQNGCSRLKTKISSKVAIVEESSIEVDTSIEPRKEAARRHRAKLGGRSYSDSHALHEEVLTLYDTEVEVFVVQDETKLRGILKQSSSTSAAIAEGYYSTDLNNSSELSVCLEMLYSGTMIESEDGFLSSTSSSLSNKNFSSDDISSCDIDAEVAAAAELKRVRFAAKPQLQLFRQNASIAGRSHKNQKKKLAKKKKKNGNVSDNDDDSNHDVGNDVQHSGKAVTSTNRRRKRTSSGGSDSGVNTDFSSSLSSITDSDSRSMPNDDDGELYDDAVMRADEQATVPGPTNDVDFVHRALNLLGLGGGSASSRMVPAENKKAHDDGIGNANGNGKNIMNLTITANGVSPNKRRRRRTRSSG